MARIENKKKVNKHENNSCFSGVLCYNVVTQDNK